MLPENLEQAADILSDMYFNSLFEKNDVEIERGVIIEEINRRKILELRAKGYSDDFISRVSIFS